MKKQILAIIVACAATLAVIPAFSGCSSDPGVKYTLYDDEGNSVKTYTVAPDPTSEETEEGEETEETEETVEAGDGYYFVVTGYTGKPSEVVIPAEYGGVPVTEIAAQAFEGLRTLTSITIADSVTSIGLGAFLYCTALKDVTLPLGLTKISQSMFAYCSSLKSIDIPDSVETIGVFAFYECESLQEVDFPSSLTIISTYAFYYCTSLNNLDFGENLEKIGYGAFFYNTSLTSLTLPDSVTYIGYAAFQSCTSITEITLGSGLTYIGSYAFCYCIGITEITIPSDVTYIGANAIYYCTSLTAVHMDNEFSDGSKKCCWLYEVDLSDEEDSDGVEEGTYAVGSDAAKDYLYTDYNYYSDTNTTGSAAGYIPTGTFEDSDYMLQLLTEDLVGMEDVSGSDVLVYWYFIRYNGTV